MSFVNKQPVSQTTRVDHPGGYHPHLADLFRLRQMEKIIHLTVEELEQVKNRLSRLEEAMGLGDDPNGIGNAARKNVVQPNPTHSTPPLPIAEIKQLAEMAKRFR
jgi:hypothetical protein